MERDCDAELCEETKIICEERLRWYRHAVVSGSVPTDGAPPCLLQLGLLAPAPSDSRTLVPVDVEIAHAELMFPLEETIDRNRRELETLASTFAPVRAVFVEAKREQQNWITEITGQSRINSTLDRAVRSCKKELITFQPGGGRDPGLLDDALARDLSMLRRGVQQRTLYQHSVRFHGPTLHYIGEIVQAGGEVRTLDEIIDRLIICDRTLAFIPGNGDRETSALQINHPAIVKFLLMTFERFWERATPVAYPNRGKNPKVTDETQLAILRLLISGYTDEAIARRLGKSRRSIAGYVSSISAEFGSRSRAQLGYLIATTGTLASDSIPITADGSE